MTCTGRLKGVLSQTVSQSTTCSKSTSDISIVIRIRVRIFCMLVRLQANVAAIALRAKAQPAVWACSVFACETTACIALFRRMVRTKLLLTAVKDYKACSAGCVRVFALNISRLCIAICQAHNVSDTDKRTDKLLPSSARTGTAGSRGGPAKRNV